MLPISEALWERADFWLILALPFLGAMLGWLGNLASHRILFGPLFAGGRDRGLLSSNAVAVSGRLATVLTPAFRLPELFRLMEPEKVATHVSNSVMARLDEYVDDVMMARHAVLWSNLPQVLRQRIYARVGRQLPSIMDNLMEDMAENVDELVDLTQLLEHSTTSKPQFLGAFLEQAFQEECRFLLRAGAWAGFGLGLLHAALWILLPTASVMIGASVALAMGALLIPRALLVSDFNGSGTRLSVWLRNDRARMSQMLSRGLVEEVLSLQHLMHRMVSGPRSARARSMIRRHMRPLLDAGLVRTTLQMLLGVEGYAHIKHRVVEKAVATTAELLADAEFNQARAVAVQAACDERLAALSARDVRSLVQAVLDEGLYTRVAAVAAIGAVAGTMQLLVTCLLQG